MPLKPVPNSIIHIQVSRTIVALLPSIINKINCLPVGHHKVNGQYGPLIVRQPVEMEAHNHLYDHDLPEHHILISDWMHSYGEQYFPGLPSSKGIFPNSVLINGRGIYTNVSR